MLLFVFALPFIAALLCLALNRVAPTRWLGILAAAALLAAAATLLLAQMPLALPVYTWATLGDQPIRLALGFDAASRPFALLVLGGGAIALLMLAVALPSGLRGFGGLFAALLLTLLATTAGLADQEPVLLPFAWALTALLGFTALRGSGTTSETPALPIGLLASLIGALALLAAALLSLDGAPSTAATPAILGCWTLVALLAFGAPPFHALFDEPSEAPAALSGALLPLGLPLLGGYMLIRFVAVVGSLPPAWRITWTLLGLLTLLVCAAGATRTTRIRQIIGWQFSAQLGLVLLAVALDSGIAAVDALTLLVNAVLTTLACYLATAVLERRAGTDDLAEIGAHGPLILPGLTFMFAAASAVGFPSAWGWWAQGALLGEVRSTIPWLVVLLLAGNTLRALAYVAPLAAFWRRAEARPTTEGRAPRRGWPTLIGLVCPAIVVLPLLIWGVAPELAWRGWLSEAQGVFLGNRPGPSLPEALTQLIFGLVALALLALPFLVSRGRSRPAPADPAMQNAAVLTPRTLGHSLRGLIWLGDPSGLFRGIWAGLLYLSRTAARLLALFEQRYYLAGLMIALIVVIMLFI